MNRLAPFLMFLLAVTWPGQPMQAQESGTDFQQLLARLGEGHPQYHAVQGEIGAARAIEEGASVYPDPLVRAEWLDMATNDSAGMPAVSSAMKYTWEQMFPLWGKRGLKGDVAAAGVRFAEARADLTLAELRAMLRLAYADFYAADRSRAINGEVLALLQDLEQSVKTRYANGLAAQQDVIKVRVEQTLLSAEQEMLNGESRQAQVAINGLIGEPADAPLASPVSLPDISAFPAVYRELRQSAAAESPLLAAADAEVQGRQAASELARRDRYPDLTLGVSPIQMDSRLDSWEFMFSVNVPLFGSRRAAQAESAAMLASARDWREAELRRVLTAAGQAFAEYEAARDQHALYEQRLVVETGLNYRAALAGYQSGQVDFDTVIAAGQQIRNARLLTLAAAVRQQRAVARFEQSTGLQP